MREIAIGVAYFILAILAMIAARETGNVAAFWPPNAVAIGLIARWRTVNFGTALVFCYVGNFFANALTGDAYPLCSLLAFANCTEIALGVVIMKSFYSQLYRDLQVRAFVFSTLTQVFGSVLLASFLGATFVHQFAGGSFLDIWLTWWASDAIGILLFLSIPILFDAGYLKSLVLSRRAELAACLAGTIVLQVGLAVSPLPAITEALTITLVWAALRFNSLIVCLVAALASVISLFDFSEGFGIAQLSSASNPAAEILEFQIRFALILFPIRILALAVEAFRLQKNQLARANLQQKNANEEMKNLLHIVSHDLKSPVMTIQGFAGLLEKYVEAEMFDKARHSVKRIREGTSIMSELIDDVLELSRMGRNRLETSDVILSSLVAEIQTLLGSQIAAKKATIRMEGDNQTFRVDRAKMLRALLNLIENALEHACSTPHMVITVGVIKRNDAFEIYVRDNGPGIPDAERSRIFDLFYRSDRTSAGTGAGLAVVQKVAERHGGNAWVYSQENQGSTFWISIPADPRGPAAHTESLLT